MRRRQVQIAMGFVFSDRRRVAITRPTGKESLISLQVLSV